MTWVKISDTLPEDPRFNLPGAAGLGAAGLALHVAGLAYCNRHHTDGQIAPQRARALLADETVHAVDLIGKLVTAGLWEVRDGALWIVDYLDDQFSAE